MRLHDHPVLCQRFNHILGEQLLTVWDFHSHPIDCGTSDYQALDMVYTAFANLHDFVNNIYTGIQGASTESLAISDQVGLPVASSPS